MIKLIDSHLHLNSPRLIHQQSEIIKEGLKTGIVSMLNVGYDYNTSIKGLEIAKNYDMVYTSVGLHPSEVKIFDPQRLNDFKKMYTYPKVVAVGEVGLDYYRNPEHKNVQKIVFEYFINISNEFKLPLILHIRDAFQECFDLLNSFSKLPKIIFHCFSGDLAEVKRALGYDSYISYAGNITYPKANILRETLELVPTTRLLLETDAPYLSPQSYRGKICKPSYILETYLFTARIKKINLESLSNIIFNNFNELFRGVV